MSTDNSHLDLPIPAGSREEWALQLAELPLQRENLASEKSFVLRLGGEWFGFPPQLIASSRLDVTPRKLPHRANSVVEGLINADGRVVPCFSFDKIFGVLPGQEERRLPGC